MTILEFTDKFPDEASCRKDFKEKRKSEGIICKTCKGLDHYTLPSREQWEWCKSCHFRTTLRIGSMMKNSNLPVRT
ncbi:MAG: hypothetical protein ACI8ZM_005353 [Crocinitomix sp.]|jgi:hypothetical protein